MSKGDAATPDPNSYKVPPDNSLNSSKNYKAPDLQVIEEQAWAIIDKHLPYWSLLEPRKALHTAILALLLTSQQELLEGLRRKYVNRQAYYMDTMSGEMERYSAGRNYAISEAIKMIDDELAEIKQAKQELGRPQND